MSGLTNSMIEDWILLHGNVCVQQTLWWTGIPPKGVLLHTYMSSLRKSHLNSELLLSDLNWYENNPVWFFSSLLQEAAGVPQQAANWGTPALQKPTTVFSSRRVKCVGLDLTSRYEQERLENVILCRNCVCKSQYGEIPQHSVKMKCCV